MLKVRNSTQTMNIVWKRRDGDFSRVSSCAILSWNQMKIFHHKFCTHMAFPLYVCACAVAKSHFAKISSDKLCTRKVYPLHALLCVSLNKRSGKIACYNKYKHMAFPHYVFSYGTSNLIPEKISLNIVCKGKSSHFHHHIESLVVFHTSETKRMNVILYSV